MMMTDTDTKVGKCEVVEVSVLLNILLSIMVTVVMMISDTDTKVGKCEVIQVSVLLNIY